MTFLTPLFLFGLLAAAIPIAIHLIRKEKPPKMVFSTLRFLKTTSKKLILFQQIQQWLLLLLRAALICLLVFAFARPLLNSSISRLVEGEPESVVILIDVSMSMRYGDRFEDAQAAALDAIDSLSAGDEVAIVAFSNAALNVQELSSDLDAARRFVRNIGEPGFETTRYMPILRLADDMLAVSSHESKTVTLISDFQANALADDDSGWQLSPGVNFSGIDIGEGASRNLYLSDVRSPAQLIESRSEYGVLARVRSAGTVHIDEAEIRLLIDGQPQEQSRISLQDASEQVVRLPVTFTTPGAHRGEIRIGSDDFAFDNTYYFTLDVIPKVRVLVLNGEPSSNWFEDEAHWFTLAIASSDESAFVVTQVEPAALNARLVAEADVIVLLNAGSDLSTGQARELQSFVEDGGSLLIAPSDRVEADGFNQRLSGLSPAQLGNQSLLAAGDYLMVADMDRRHPVLLPLVGEWNVRFSGYWFAQAYEDATVLMEFDNGAPALLERHVGAGRVLLFTSSLDTEWNNLPLQSLYLPFLHESMGYLAQIGTKERAYQIGDVIDLAGLADGSSELSVTNGAGDSIALDGESMLYSASELGFIEASSANGSQVFAINSAPEESVLTRVAVSAVQDAVTNADTQPVQSERVRTAELVAQLEGNQRLWWWIFLLAMVLLLAETRISNTTYR